MPSRSACAGTCVGKPSNPETPCKRSADLSHHPRSQIVDDILDLTASSSMLGKPALNDLKSGLATAPVCPALLRSLCADLRLLQRLFPLVCLVPVCAGFCTSLLCLLPAPCPGHSSRP
jgi:hypothetical protein